MPHQLQEYLSIHDQHELAWLQDNFKSRKQQYQTFSTHG